MNPDRTSALSPASASCRRVKGRTLLLKTLTVAAGLFVAGMSFAAAPASAAPASGTVIQHQGLVDTVQYGYGERRGYGPRPGRVIGRILGGRPGYRDRGFGYGRGRDYGPRRFDRY
jgi:hypothetical protein